jgi:F-box-like
VLPSGVTPRFPPELWLNIFPYVPPNSIEDVTLTCKLFCDLAQPLLFSQPLTLNAFAHGPSGLLPLSPADVKKSLDLLVFCTSERIAPSIRHWNVQHLPGADAGEDHTNPQDHTNLNLVLDKFLTMLPCFVNLKSIRFCDMEFGDVEVESLCRLRKLEKISLRNCGVKITKPANARIRIDDLAVSAMEPWLDVLDWENMTCLRSPRSLPPSLLTSLQGIQELHVSLAPSIIFPLLDALPHLPLLNTLHLTYDTFDENAPYPSSVHHRPIHIPLLATYQGPYELFHLLSSDEDLLSLHLWSFSGFGGDPEAMISAIRNHGSWASKAWDVGLDVSYLNEVHYCEICKFFPHLLGFSLAICPPEEGPPEESFTRVVRHFLVFSRSQR